MVFEAFKWHLDIHLMIKIRVWTFAYYFITFFKRTRFIGTVCDIT